MKLRYVISIAIFIVIVSAGVGLYYKAGYRDFNEDTKNQFVVALIDQEFLAVQLEFMEEDLDSSNIILAVKCEDYLTYRYSSVTQKASIVSVFKGEGLHVGDKIEIARAYTLIGMDKETFIDGRIPMNMGYVNEMTPGKIYLVFLDAQLQTYDKNTVVYKQSEDFLMAPIFCYEKMKNTPQKPNNDYSSYVNWETVANNEFFIMSDESSKQIDLFKDKLFAKYAYD